MSEKLPPHQGNILLFVAFEDYISASVVLVMCRITNAIKGTHSGIIKEEQEEIIQRQRHVKVIKMKYTQFATITLWRQKKKVKNIFGHNKLSHC